MAASAASLAYVQKMFLAYFGRPVAPTGQDYYAGLIDAGNVAALQDDFWNSTESQSKFSSLTTEGKVTAIFQQLFGRDPAISGLTYWTTQINSGAVSLPAAALTILNSATGDDLTVFNAKLKVAEAFTAELDTAAEVTGFQANTAAAVKILADIKTDAAADAAVADIKNIVAGVVANDTTAPVITANQTFSYAENQVADAVLGTVAATDAGGVTGFEIKTGNDSGYFAISSAGKITLTTAGLAAASNDFETTPNTFTLGVAAKDIGGNTSTTTNITLNVTDVDDVAPELVAATASATTVKLNFDEAFKSGLILPASAFTVIDSVNTSITINSVVVSGSSVTLTLATTPSGTLKVSYTAPTTGDVLQDAAGNKVAAIVNQTTVSDVTAPTLTASTPADGDAAFAAGSNLTLTFSEDVVLGTGSITIVNAADSTDTRTIAVTDADQVSVSGKVLTINPTADLKAGVAYYVNIPATAVLDAAGNAYTGISNTTTLNFTTSAGSSSGQTFTLTTATDVLPGLLGTSGTSDTSGNDIIIGDVGTTVTVQGSDQINGGTGVDTLKVFGAYTAGTSATGIVTGVENLYIATVADAAQNFSALTKAATGIEKVEIADASLLSGRTITTTTGQSLSLATGNSSAVTAGTVTWAASATDTSLNLNFNGYQAISGGAPAAVTVTGAVATTLNISSTGGSNKTATFTGPTTVTSHVISGDKAFTYAVAAADAAALNSINAMASTGGVSADVSAGANKVGFTFTGGSGNDTIKLANDQLGTFTAGTQLVGGEGTGDKIGLLDTALTAAEAAKINAATGFEVLGLNAAITLDASLLTSIKKFSIDTTALTQTINNLATGSTTTVTTGTPTSLTLSTATGVTDTKFVLGTSTSTGLTATTVVTSGITTLAIESNGTAGSTNTITTLTNSDNSNITVTGSAALTITNALAGTAIGSKVDASAATGVLTVVGSGFADVLIGGSAADVMTAAAGIDTLTGNAGADKFVFSTANLDTTAGAVTDIITDFTTGSDKIVNTVVAAAGSSTNYVEATAAVADLATLLTAAGTALDGTVKFYVGQVGSDSYVVMDTEGTGYTDVIKLTGVALTGIAMTDIYAS